jgi:hypothetical protein
MRPIRLITLAALLLPLLAFAPAAHAQASGSPPAARALLPASVLATLLQNSVHVAGSVDISASGVSAGSIDLSGDFAWQDQIEGSLHLQTASPVIASTLGASAVDLIVVGQRAAARVGAGAWQCSSTAKGAASTTGSATASTKKARSPGKAKGKSSKKGKKSKKSASGAASATAGSAAMTQAIPQFGQPVDLGAETLDGVAVWHVQSKSTGSVTDTSTIDLYVTQSDLTLKRVILSESTTASPAMTVTATVDLSQYGEPVSVSLPAACAGSARALTATQQSLLRTLGRMLWPQGLLSLLPR